MIECDGKSENDANQPTKESNPMNESKLPPINKRSSPYRKKVERRNQSESSRTLKSSPKKRLLNQTRSHTGKPTSSKLVSSRFLSQGSIGQKLSAIKDSLSGSKSFRNQSKSSSLSGYSHARSMSLDGIGKPSDVVTGIDGQRSSTGRLLSTALSTVLAVSSLNRMPSDKSRPSQASMKKHKTTTLVELVRNKTFRSKFLNDGLTSEYLGKKQNASSTAEAEDKQAEDARAINSETVMISTVHSSSSSALKSDQSKVTESGSKKGVRFLIESEVAKPISASDDDIKALTIECASRWVWPFVFSSIFFCRGRVGHIPIKSP